MAASSFASVPTLAGNSHRFLKRSTSATRSAKPTARNAGLRVNAMAEEEKSRIGLCGLAVMGQNLALNVAEKGFPISVYNRSGDKTDNAVARAKKEGLDNLRGYKDMGEFVASLQKPRSVIILVKAGAPVDATIEAHGTRRHHHRRRQRVVRKHRAPPEGGGGEGLALPRHGRERRRGGRPQRSRDDARRRQGCLRRHRGRDQEGVRADRLGTLRDVRRARGRGQLRQDGAQRHRVRRHAAHLRGVRRAQDGGRAHERRARRRVQRVERRRAGLVPHRHQRADPRQGRRPEARGGVPGGQDPGQDGDEGHGQVDRAASRRALRGDPHRRVQPRRALPLGRQGGARRRRGCLRRRGSAPRGRQDCLLDPRGEEEARRRRPRSALRLQDLLLRAGHEPHPRQVGGAGMEPGPGRDGAHLEGRVHHPRALPRPHQEGVRSRRGAALAARGRRVCGGAGGAQRQLASRGDLGHRRRGGHPVHERLSGVLRLVPPRQAPRQPGAGAAGLLRLPHVRAHGHGGLAPHRLVRHEQRGLHHHLGLQQLNSPPPLERW